MQRTRAQEQFSFAYITAVASQAEIQVELRRLDEDGIDGELISDVGTEPRLDFQAKSTYQEVEKPDHVAYPLKVENYNKLIKATTVPRILIVTLVPANIEDWLLQDGEKMLSRKCAYWYHLRGMKPSSNIDSETVHIPKSQVFSAEALKKLIELADAGDLDD